jgi:hypothetical protein
MRPVCDEPEGVAPFVSSVSTSDPTLPTLPPLRDDGRDAPAPAPRRRPPRSTDGGGPRRRLWSAGHALIVSALALALGALLNAPGMHKSAYNRPEGATRDVALAITGPLADVSHALLLDRPRALVKAAIGRSDDDEIDTEIALPAPSAPKPTTPVAPRRLAFSPENKLRLWVAGDSLVITPGLSVLRAAIASPAIASAGGVDGRVATGLTRPDVFNWFKQIEAKLAELKPRAVVLAFGANDDKAYMTGVPEGVSIGSFGDAAWRSEYARRAGGLMDTINRAGAFVVWIGLPQTRSLEQTQRFDVVNAVVQREAAKRKGKVAFVDTYTMFAGDDGGYTDYLETASGRLLQVRARDGVHFQPAGGDIIARAVLKSLNKAYDLTSWRRTTQP